MGRFDWIPKWQYLHVTGQTSLCERKDKTALM